MTIAIGLDEGVPSQRLPGLATAAVMSIAGGAIHAAATGVHAEHPQLARIFVVTAALQLGAGLLALARPTRAAALVTAAVNAAAVAGWAITRVSGISWIDGLETKEAPQFADTACALAAAVAAGAALAALLVGWQRARPVRLLLPALAAAVLAVPAMISGGTHVHSHDEVAGAGAHVHDEGELASGTPSGGEGAAAAPADHTHDTVVDDGSGSAPSDATGADDGHTHDTVPATPGGHDRGIPPTASTCRAWRA
ncbi:MAG: hypothetical protein HZB15_09820 [Actinobacteria bacterium]|nr:hypothetical protein [Actinomycetota bacterium]